MSDPINMSLDELIKSTRKNSDKKKKSAVAAVAAKAATPKKNKKPVKETPNKPNGKNNKGNNNNNGGGANANTANARSQKNIAQSIGAGKAKRTAILNQQRNLSGDENNNNNNGGKKKVKVSNAEISKEVNKQLNKLKGKPATNANNNNNNKTALNAPTGLKISFNPAELKQTTDKTVAQQIQGALAKQGKTKPLPVLKNGGAAVGRQIKKN